MTSQPQASALRTANLTKSYGQIAAVSDVSLELEAGRILALIGPSGCGKTTLLRLIAGLETPDQGVVEISGVPVAGIGVFAPPEKRQVGIVFQDYALFPHLSVAANIAYGLPKGPERSRRVRDILALVGLKGFEDRAPHQLSGGEQQRVALARALAPGPKLLLMDEPFSNLDPDLRARVRREVKEILTRSGATVVFVTHDQDEALYMGDLIAVMDRGRLEQVDTPERVFHSPATTFVASFIGHADFLTALPLDGDCLMTGIGPVSVEAAPAGLDADANLQVMVRPDDLFLHPSMKGDGAIVERTFLGGFYLYRVVLDSGESCHSLLSHTQRLEVGARVDVQVNAGHPLICFQDGRAVPRPLIPSPSRGEG
jgi:iron(III) transport system ATP-binding protein